MNLHLMQKKEETAMKTGNTKIRTDAELLRIDRCDSGERVRLICCTCERDGQTYRYLSLRIYKLDNGEWKATDRGLALRPHEIDPIIGALRVGSATLNYSHVAA